MDSNENHNAFYERIMDEKTLETHL